MQIRQIPRTAVRTSFRAARLPLTVAETVFRRDKEWLPTRAYETVESRFKQVVGRAVHDDALVEDHGCGVILPLTAGGALEFEDIAEVRVRPQ